MELEALKSSHQLKRKNSSEEIKIDLQPMDLLIYKKELTLITLLLNHRMED